MRNVTLVGRLWNDRDGATILEFTLVFPLLMLITFCTVDIALIMADWAQANKAVQNGARLAVVGNPVATGLNNLTYNTANMGDDCSDPTTGNDQNVCDDIETVCIATAASGDCTHPGYPDFTFDNAAFEPILAEMRSLAPLLKIERENVQISYRTTGLGFVGRPGGLPMEVTVELRCMTHQGQVFFLAALGGWVFDWSEDCPAGTSGIPVPSFATTLTTESLGS